MNSAANPTSTFRRSILWNFNHLAPYVATTFALLQAGAGAPEESARDAVEAISCSRSGRTTQRTVALVASRLPAAARYLRSECVKLGEDVRGASPSPARDRHCCSVFHSAYARKQIRMCALMRSCLWCQIGRMHRSDFRSGTQPRLRSAVHRSSTALRRPVVDVAA